MAGSMKEKGILRAQAVVRERTKRHAQRGGSDRHGFRTTPPKKALGKKFTKTVGRSFAKGVASGGLKALRFAGPVGVAFGAAHGAHQISKAAYHGVKAISAYKDLDVAKKKSKAKYGTLRAAAATRRKMTGK